MLLPALVKALIKIFQEKKRKERITSEVVRLLGPLTILLETVIAKQIILVPQPKATPNPS